MEDIGSFVFESAVCLVLMALGAITAWKFWHGRWLRLIAGNTFATEEEMRGPYQRALGRRAAVVMLCCCGSLALLMFLSLAEAAGGGTPGLDSLMLAVAAALILVPCIYLVIWSNKAAVKARKALLAADPSKAADAKLDRRAGIVLLCILGAYLFIMLVVVPLAAK